MRSKYVKIKIIKGEKAGIAVNNNEIIKDILSKEGIDEVGLARVEHELPLAVSVVVPLSKFVLEKITDKPTFEYFHHYT